MAHPDSDDVVVRRSNSPNGYLLGTSAVPNQLIVHSHDEAVSHALTYARRQRVCAWMAQGGDDAVLLGTFRKLAVSS